MLAVGQLCSMRGCGAAPLPTSPAGVCCRQRAAGSEPFGAVCVWFAAGERGLQGTTLVKTLLVLMPRIAVYCQGFRRVKF